MTTLYVLEVTNAPTENNFTLPQGTFRDIEFILENCGCKRHLHGVHENPSELFFNQTTCGSDSFYRGPHQKIIGFSYYGDINSDKHKMKGYFEGIIGNLKLIPKLYPGWTIRLYYDLDKNDPVLKEICNLACSDTNIDICDTKHLPGIPFVSQAFFRTFLKF